MITNLLLALKINAHTVSIIYVVKDSSFIHQTNYISELINY